MKSKVAEVKRVKSKAAEVKRVKSKAAKETAKLPVAVGKGTSEQQSQLKLLIARGKEQGYLTYAEVNDHLPNDIVDPEQIEDIVNMINDMGITVHEKAPDAESLVLSDAAVNDDEAVEEAAAALATVDSEFGRTTDPVRMYMREMGTVELLTREGEIRIAKRIEEGLNQVKSALSYFPPTMETIIVAYEPVQANEARLHDVARRVSSIPTNLKRSSQPAQSRKKMTDEEEDTGPDPAEVEKRFKSIFRRHKRILDSIEADGG